MGERANEIVGRVTALGGRRLGALGAGVGLIVILVLIASWGAGPRWVPVATGLPLEAVGEMTKGLDEIGVPYRLGAGGLRVEVAESDLARARVELASRGMPGESGPGFELFDQPAWGMTDFTQRINYRRALEGELERTIGDMDGVESARVHLALQQGSVLRRSSRPTEASVVVRMSSGARPTGSLVEGVTFLVASSVDELSSEHVSVLDHTGRLLSRSVEDDTGFGLSNRQLELRESVEGYLEQKAEALVTDVLGPGNVRVRVAAELNLDRVDRTVQSVSPEDQLVTREERTEVTPGPEDVGAGSVAYKTDYETTRTVERFSGGFGDVKRLSVAVLVNETVGEGAAAPDPSRIQALVAAAVGMNPERGDVISVVSVPFGEPEPLPPAPTGPGLWEIWDQLQRPVLTVLALILAFVLGLKLVRTAGAGIQGAGRSLEAGGVEESLPAGASSSVRALNKSAGLRKQLSAAHAERMQEVTSGVLERPDMAARVMQAWLKE